MLSLKKTKISKTRKRPIIGTKIEENVTAKVRAVENLFVSRTVTNVGVNQ